MRIRKSIPLAALALVTINAVPIGATPTSDLAPSGLASLIVKPHAGAESIDVSGRAAIGHAITISLVSTIDRDLPDVLLSRTMLYPGGDGMYSAVISIAPGFTRGSIITVFATPSDGGPAATARYLPDAPNRGVVIPLDDIPRAVR